MPDELDEPTVTQYITGGGASAVPLARQLSKAFGLGIGLDEIMAALEGLGSWGPAAALSGEGSLTAGSGIPGVSLSGQGSLTVGGPAAAIRVAAIAGTVIVSEGGAAADSISVIRQADIGEVGERASRGGLAALTAVQWLLAAVILIAAVYPFLPPQVQAEIQGEAALVAAIAAVLAIIKRLHVPDL